MEESLALPPAEEITQLFKDFKQVLRIAKYQTPLQRAQQNIARKSCIALCQKAESEAERVFNLLPPGHGTRLHVDLLRSVLAHDLTVFLRVPVSLLSDGRKVALLKNNSLGQVTIKSYNDLDRAFQAFTEEVTKCGPVRNYSPRFVHKSDNAVTTFHASDKSALAAWSDDQTAAQQLQQYVQSHSGMQSLVRVHWKAAQQATCYFISHGPVKTQFPSLALKSTLISRSFSEPDTTNSHSWITKSPTNLIVQRAKVPSHLATEVSIVVKILEKSLSDGENVGEVVCDFTSDQKHQWVFLQCRGFTFRSRHRLTTKTLQPCQPINLAYLMYPMIARKSAMNKRLRWHNKLKEIAAKHNISVTALMKSMNESVPLSDDSEDEPSSPGSLSSKKRSESIVLATIQRRSAESDLITREVGRFERLMRGSRLCREEAASKIDFVRRSGGLDCWQPLIHSAVKRFHESDIVSEIGLKDMGFEQTSAKVNSLLRIARGDYNFYYREALRRVHSPYNIEVPQFRQFLLELRAAFFAGTHNAEDAALLLQRFASFEEVICRRSGTQAKSRGKDS